MPYGIDKDSGGDSPSNVKWMEKCVTRVMKTGKDKGSAIAICKAQLKKVRGNKEKASLNILILLEKL